MSRPRFFVEGVAELDVPVPLRGGDARKILTVLRMRDGDEIEIVDSAARRFHATIAAHRDEVRVTPVRALGSAAPESGLPRITVAQAIPKGAKMDYVVEKLTELGVACIAPLVTERAIGETSRVKLERWRRLAKSAALQCGRAQVPDVTDATSLDAFLARANEFDRVLFPWELAPRLPLRDVLQPLVHGAKSLAVAIGPEGGFSHDEAAAARAAGAAVLSLGPRILRTETAALALVSVIAFLTENGEAPQAVV